MGVRAFNEWRIEKMKDPSVEEFIVNCDLNEVKGVDKNQFIASMCRFIPEVVKVDGTDYPGKILYEMVTSIQKYFHQGGVYWKLLDDVEFCDIRNMLDNVMKERALTNVGVIKRQASFISMDVEKELWKKGILDEDTADKLRDTVLFLLGINLGLRAVDEHYELRRDAPGKPSQLTFERSDKGQRCLVYREDTVTKTNDGGLRDLKKDRKVVWIYPSDNINHCPVRIVDKYISLCPEVNEKSKNKKTNFYLSSLKKPNPAQWYGVQVVGKYTLAKTVSRMLKDAQLDGYFTNHSLCRTGTTRLFRVGVDRKLIKEYTGHKSDAVDNYQVTSDDQRESLSVILQGGRKDENQTVMTETPLESQSKSLEISVSDYDEKGQHCFGCKCKKEHFELSKNDEITKFIASLLKTQRSGKATIKIDIEFSQ